MPAKDVGKDRKTAITSLFRFLLIVVNYSIQQSPFGRQNQKRQKRPEKRYLPLHGRSYRPSKTKGY